MPGHPDGQNYAIWRGPDFFVSSGIHIDSTHNATAQGQVTNYASVYLNVDPQMVPGVTATLNWYSDSTLSLIVKTHLWKVPVGTKLGCIIPASGNFVIMTVTTSSVAGGNVAISMFPTNTPASSLRYLDTGNRVQQFNLSVPLSSTKTDILPFVCAGNGYIYIADRNSTAKLSGRIVTLDENANSVARIVSWNTLTAFQAQQFNTDAQPLRVEVDNTDGAAAHFVDYYVSVDGR